jgi:hypothetical protein
MEGRKEGGREGGREGGMEEGLKGVWEWGWRVGGARAGESSPSDGMTRCGIKYSRGISAPALEP